MRPFHHNPRTTVLWLALCGAAMLSILWCLPGRRPRFVGAMVLSTLAVAASIAGFILLRVNYTQTINGQTTLHLVSRWFFAGSLLLALTTFANALRGNRRQHCSARNKRVCFPP